MELPKVKMPVTYAAMEKLRRQHQIGWPHDRLDLAACRLSRSRGTT